LQAGDDSRAAKLDQKINAGQNRIEALKAEKNRILAELAGLYGGRQALALAA